ncbi:phosphotransferase [Herbidospora yilanensis]|uniref:phosphotransferase n=1 Tax=Herbidospora yilanensis TaxID=354426 RepID=UPI0034E1B687
MNDTNLEITADVVRALLLEQHPDLVGRLAIREVEGGWGNQMWRLGDELAVRMQRMDSTPALQLKERRRQPVLASRLPLPVPTPVGASAATRAGLAPAAPGADPGAVWGTVRAVPQHWTVMTWVSGEPLDHGSISRAAHPADTLASFLRALHVRRPPRHRSVRTAVLIPGAARPALRTSSRPSPSMTLPLMSGPSGTTRSWLACGRARRCGCKATSIQPTSSS